MSKQIDISKGIIQPSELFLQAAGSNGKGGTSGIVSGIHLRWALQGNLGENHLPKGNLAKTNSGYNKPDDFVGIYRASLIRSVINIPISTNPTSFDKNARTVDYVINQGEERGVTARFTFSNTINNYGGGPLETYLNNYNGVVEFQIVGELMYRIDLTTSGNTMNTEVISVRGNDNLNRYEGQIIGRKSYQSGTNTIQGENIHVIRFNPKSKQLNQLSCQTYTSTIHGINKSTGWDFLGQFALTMKESEAFDRLKSSDIHDKWPKYNDDARVNAFNYEDRWRNHLIEGIEDYIELSETDTKAKERLETDGEIASQMNVSFLKLLQIAALDYHVARMLGLGYIDDSVEEENQNYIYLAKYLKSTGESKEKVVPLFAMSLPTTLLNYRQPPKPVLKPIEYGLKVNTHTNAPILLTDKGGYLQNQAVRYININRGDYQFTAEYTDTFWAGSQNFIGEGHNYIRPVSYGIDYREKGGDFIKPELNHDEEYLDTLKVNETVTALAGKNPIYVHNETKPGIHQYKIYGVNWFSRMSEISNQVETDETVFPKPNNLLPPVNLAAQYIQEEKPLIFTSKREQEILGIRKKEGERNPNFLRVTFDWNFIHNAVYQHGEYVKLYYRENKARNVRGEIKSITQLGDNLIEVKTKSYRQVSVNPVRTISPVIDSKQITDFIGSLFACNEEHYLVKDVKYNSTGAIFILQKNKIRHIHETDNNKFTAAQEYIQPSVGDRFMVVESLAEKKKWTAFKTMIHLDAPIEYKDKVNNGDGTFDIINYGGIFEDAEITADEKIVGAYTIKFKENVLPKITTPNAEWYKGSARLLIEGTDNERKVVDCWRIEEGHIIHVYDSNPEQNPIQEGWVSVNFHPGYRVYIYPNDESHIDWRSMTPQIGKGSKTTYIAASGLDTTISPENESPLTPPVPMLAMEYAEPQQPQLPIGPTFATRPDFYGKSSFTFDTVLNNRNPYALLFYRANERAILDRLYLPKTVEEIYANLAALGKDEFRVNRWQDLVNLKTEEGKFISYQDYAFPLPDNKFENSQFDGKTSIDKLKNQVLDAIAAAFLSLTRQPVVYDYLKVGFQTSNNLPVLRNNNLELLTPNDAEFDPFPMARITNKGEKQVRFTDYSLDGASKHIYFFCVAEMSDRMELSAFSPILGPIELINAFPVETPAIKQVLTQMQDDLLNLPVGVRFTLNPYTKTEAAQVKKVRIYRAYNLEDTHTVRTMQLVDTVDYASEIVDEFKDVNFPPFGETLYYRLVALREIKNENNEIEYVPSKPSKVVMTNIIDVVNPSAPLITEDIGLDTGEELQNVILNWEKATHNGSYYLYKMNNVGNWIKIYEVQSNEDSLHYPPFVGGNPDFTNYPETQLLDKVDDDDNPMYHRFKVVVENASGLLSLQENILTI